jgi:LytR cell envelope-related transcriptional attenuator
VTSVKPLTRRVRDERGLVLPTRLLALCISAVAMAALVIIADDPDQAPDDEATPAQTTPSKDASTAPSATPSPSAKAKPKPKPVKRGDTYVTIFNNTRVKGLAGGVAEKAKGAGWNVVATDNWYGTVDGTAVYYPPRLKTAAEELGFDLGIKRIKPSQDPMQFDRLTVILTDDYHG